MSPFDAWRFLTEAQAVMLRRSLALLAEPHMAGPALARMALEKHAAFSAGAAAAGVALVRGLIDQGLSTSRRLEFARPPSKSYAGSLARFAL